MDNYGVKRVPLASSSMRSSQIVHSDDSDVINESEPRTKISEEESPCKIPKSKVKKLKRVIVSSDESDGDVKVRKTDTSNWYTATSRHKSSPKVASSRVRVASSSGDEELTPLDLLQKQRQRKNLTTKPNSPKKSVVSKSKIMEESIVSNVENGVEEHCVEDEDTPPVQSSKRQARKQRQQICLDFFNTADEKNLLDSCPTLTPERTSIIIALRPFNDFEHLFNTFCETKGIRVSIIDNHMDAIKLQLGLDNLLKVCHNYCCNVQSATQAATQPEIMTKELKLKPYQLLGLGWLQSMHKNKLNSILADEMGLGKTVQVIALLSWLKETGRGGTHLVCVPSSTLNNWKNELSRWSPTLNVCFYYGDLAERGQIRDKMRRNRANVDIILTTYNMMQSKPEDKKFFRKANIQYSVFDEAHMLKNATTARYTTLMRSTTERTILLTGTPLQNGLSELISLINFVMPHLVSEHVPEFTDILKHFHKKEAMAEYEKSKIVMAKEILKPFYLRRVKAEILQELPAKSEKVMRCALLHEQQQLYDDVVQQLKDSGDPCGSLNNLMMLRKITNHPLLYRNLYDDDKILEIAKKLYAKDKAYYTSKVDHIHEDLSFMTDLDIHHLCLKHKCINSWALERELFQKSTKVQALKQILAEQKTKGNKVLIFSQFVIVLDILDVVLEDWGYQFLRLDGQTPVSERQDLINEFNEDPDLFVFTLSTRAGGLGINLTAANVIVLHDIDFNPYNDKQAEDRCHRLGQTKPVHVMKLIGQGTVEEGMLACAQNKLLLELQVTGNSGDILDEESNLDMAGKIMKEAFAKKNE